MGAMNFNICFLGTSSEPRMKAAPESSASSGTVGPLLLYFIGHDLRICIYIYIFLIPIDL